MLNVTFSIAADESANYAATVERGMYEQGIYHERIGLAVKFIVDWYMELVSEFVQEADRLRVDFKDGTVMTISA